MREHSKNIIDQKLNFPRGYNVFKYKKKTKKINPNVFLWQQGATKKP